MTPKMNEVVEAFLKVRSEFEAAGLAIVSVQVHMESGRTDVSSAANSNTNFNSEPTLCIDVSLEPK